MPGLAEEIDAPIGVLGLGVVPGRLYRFACVCLSSPALVLCWVWCSEGIVTCVLNLDSNHAI